MYKRSIFVIILSLLLHGCGGGSSTDDNGTGTETSPNPPIISITPDPVDIEAHDSQLLTIEVSDESTTSDDLLAGLTYSCDVHWEKSFELEIYQNTVTIIGLNSFIPFDGHCDFSVSNTDGFTSSASVNISIAAKVALAENYPILIVDSSQVTLSAGASSQVEFDVSDDDTNEQVLLESVSFECEANWQDSFQFSIEGKKITYTALATPSVYEGICTLSISDQYALESTSTINVSIVDDAPPTIKTDEVVYEIEGSGSLAFAFTIFDDNTPEQNLFDSFDLNCDGYLEGSFDITYDLPLVIFDTKESFPNYQGKCVASVIDQLGQTSSSEFELIRKDGLLKVEVTINGEQIVSFNQPVEIDFDVVNATKEIKVEVLDVDLEPVDGFLSLDVVGNTITVSINDDVEVPDEGLELIIGVEGKNETNGMTLFYPVRLANDVSPYNNLINAYNQAMFEFQYSRDYYHLAQFMLDLAHNKQLLDSSEYREKFEEYTQLMSNYESSITGSYEASKAIANLPRYTPQEVEDITTKLTGNDSENFDYGYFLSVVQNLVNALGSDSFPVLPALHGKVKQTDNSYSNFIGQNAYGEYVEGMWRFNDSYAYLSNVVDMKYWFQVMQGNSTIVLTSANILNYLSLTKTANKTLTVKPLGYRSKSKLKLTKNENNAVLQSSGYNDPLNGKQRWLIEQSSVPGAQSLAQLKQRYPEKVMSRIAVIDGNFTHSDEINFANESFDLVDMDNDAYIDLNTANSGYYGFHGMAVASIIGAVSNNDYGLTGGLDDVEIVPVRVFGEGNSTKNGYSDGVRWAAGAHIDGIEPISQPVDVINLSLGRQSDCSAQEQDAINYALSQGVIVVAASGNDSTNISNTPAKCVGVIAVGANTLSGNRADFSNYDINGVIDISAVGVDVPVLDIQIGEDSLVETFEYWNGTSFATPIVSAVVALIKQHSDTTPAAFVQQYLTKSAGEFMSTCLDCGPGIAEANVAMDKSIEKPFVFSLELRHKYDGFESQYQKAYVETHKLASEHTCDFWSVMLANDIVLDNEYEFVINDPQENVLTADPLLLLTQSENDVSANIQLKATKTILGQAESVTIESAPVVCQ